MTDAKREGVLADEPNAQDPERRNLAMALLGALGGGALLQGCGAESPAREDLGQGSAAATGTSFVWFDFMFPATPNQTLKGTSGTANQVAVVQNYSTVGDGGGGVFWWDTAQKPDDGGTIVNPSGGTNQGWRRIYSGPLDVRWFGAKANGSDDQPAIQRALTAAASRNQQILHGVGMGESSGTAQEVFFPSGIYTVMSSLSAHAYMHLRGERAMIVAAINSAVDILTGVTRNTTIEGLVFRGGRRAVSISTGNLSDATIDIVDCEFIQNVGNGSPFGAAIYADTTCGGGTLLNVVRCKFINEAVGASGQGIDPSMFNVIRLDTIDCCIVADCWVTSAALETFFIGSASLPAVFYLRNMTGVPDTAVPPLGGATRCWIRNVNGHVTAEGCKFGGEGGGFTILKNYTGIDLANPTVVRFRKNEGGVGTHNGFEFYAVPNILDISENAGQLRAVWIDPAIGTVARTDLAYLTTFRMQDNQNPTWFSSNADGGITASLLSARELAHGNVIPTADRLLAIPATSGGYGQAIVLNGTSTPLSTNSTFGTGDALSVTATANDANIRLYFTTAMQSVVGGPVAGAVYTLVVELTISGAPVTVLMMGAGGSRECLMNPGRHIVCQPFVYVALANGAPASGSIGQSSATVGVEVSQMRLNTTVVIGPFRVFRGDVVVETANSITCGDAQPMGNVLQWCRGDVVTNTTPMAGGYAGWICVTAGAPGTWKGTGLIQA